MGTAGLGRRGHLHRHGRPRTKRLIAKSGRHIEIVYTGLRPEEKPHEVLFSASEAGTPSSHPLISHVQVPPLHPMAVRHDARSHVSVDLREFGG